MELPCRGKTEDCVGASWRAFGAKFVAAEDSVTAIEVRNKSVILIEKARTDVLLEVAVVDGTVREISIVSPAQPYRHDLASGRFIPRAPGRTANFTLKKERQAK